MIRRPPRSTLSSSSAASDVYKRQIQHLSAVIRERVNRFFGWQAIGRIALRQAPLRRREPPTPPPPLDPEVAARIAASLPAIEDEDLRQALARLGAAIKRK